MSNEFEGSSAHSAEYFGDTRDFWYAEDFLALVRARWGLAEVRTVLDVGSGAGHWARVLGKMLPADARLVGLDREPTWVAAAAARCAAAAYGDRFSFQVGTAERLPFPDGTFDLVTCQTVLIHCPDPRAVLAEMVRVTRPGGLVAVAEPNNVAGPLQDPFALSLPLGELMDRVRFHVLCERGKAALGEGNNSIGELVPGMFAVAGLEDVRVFLNDRASALVPPYASAYERAQVDEQRSAHAREVWAWSRVDTERYFLAGGGDPNEFEGLWRKAGERSQAVVDGIADGTWACGGGSVCFLVSGRRRG